VLAEAKKELWSLT